MPTRSMRCTCAPVVIQSERQTRMMILWSAYANRVMAFRITSAIKPGSLEVVSTPVNALLVYDSRHGQFINGVTGLSVTGFRPEGVLSPLLTTKTTWRQWRTLHPTGKLMSWRPRLPGPRQPIRPAYPFPPDMLGRAVAPGGTRVAVIESSPRLFIDDSLLGGDPVNLQSGATPIVLLRRDAGLCLGRLLHNSHPGRHEKPRRLPH